MEAKEQGFFTVKDVSAADFIRGYADWLKKNNKLDIPAWTTFIKSGIACELAPYDDDWVYIRTASVARKIYLRGHLGVGTMKHIFGKKQRRGVLHPIHVAASGKIIRWALQQLEKLQVVKKDKKSTDKKSSRIITPEGMKALNHIATEIAKNKKAKK